MPGFVLSTLDLLDTLWHKVKAPLPAPVPAPGWRRCCMLAEERALSSNVVELEPLSFTHVYGAGGLIPNDPVGQLYTIAGGFVDFGHLRDIGDLTKYYYDRLRLSNNAGDVLDPPFELVHGTVTLLHDVPEEWWVERGAQHRIRRVSFP